MSNDKTQVIFNICKDDLQKLLDTTVKIINDIKESL